MFYTRRSVANNQRKKRQSSSSRSHPWEIISVVHEARTFRKFMSFWDLLQSLVNFFVVLVLLQFHLTKIVFKAFSSSSWIKSWTLKMRENTFFYCLWIKIKVSVFLLFYSSSSSSSTSPQLFVSHQRKSHANGSFSFIYICFLCSFLVLTRGVYVYNVVEIIKVENPKEISNFSLSCFYAGDGEKRQRKWKKASELFCVRFPNEKQSWKMAGSQAGTRKRLTTMLR